MDSIITGQRVNVRHDKVYGFHTLPVALPNSLLRSNIAECPVASRQSEHDSVVPEGTMRWTGRNAIDLVRRRGVKRLE